MSNRINISRLVGVAGIVALHAVAGLTPAQGQCAFEWAPGFTAPGTNGTVFAMAVFDDGNGPALYVGGWFTKAGGVEANYIGKWDGSLWSPLGSGVNDRVMALTVFDDGTGPAVYAGGFFDTAGGVTVDGIAKWDGTAWFAVGEGMAGSDYPFVHALTVVDGDGRWPAALYAGGEFNVAGGVEVNYVAQWDGSSWSPLGTGMNEDVRALTAFDDGQGLALYAGGWFTTAGGIPAIGIAEWDGTSWSAVGGGMGGDYPAVYALTVHDGGDGQALYAGGYFTMAGGSSANHIAAWDGTAWSTLSTGTNNYVTALAGFDLGDGPALYVGGRFTEAGGVGANCIAKWGGAEWSALGDGMGGDAARVYALAGFDDGNGPRLYAGGYFYTAGGRITQCLAAWDGVDWPLLGHGTAEPVLALAQFDDGAGAALYAGGAFDTIGGIVVNGIAKWNGQSWSALADGVGGYNPFVYALAVFDDGNGPALYAGGPFHKVGQEVMWCIAKWDGTAWSDVGGGMGTNTGQWPAVHALTVFDFDDGTGPALYAGGEFTIAGGIEANYVAKWDGSNWSPLGDGVGNGFQGYVSTLAGYDDGSGPALYAGGYFTTAGGLPANYVAKWDGSNWSALGSGMDARVRDLLAYDDGSGVALYAAGGFTTAGGDPAEYIAKWDGANWSALPERVNHWVYTLAVFDEGSGPALYAGGPFTRAGGTFVNHIARWDGSNWSALGGGMGGCANPYVYAMTDFDDGGGPSLYVGGGFATAGDFASGCIAKWARAFGPGDLNGDGCVDQADLGILLADWGCTSDDCPGDCDCDGDTDQADLGILLAHWGEGCP